MMLPLASKTSTVTIDNLVNKINLNNILDNQNP